MAVVPGPASMTWVQNGLMVGRQTTSYPARPVVDAGGSHRSTVSLVSTDASMSTCCGIPGAWARDHSDAPFTRATPLT